MNIKELRELIAGVPDHVPVDFQLDPNGTDWKVAMSPGFMFSSDQRMPETVVGVTFHEQPTAEEESKQFEDQVRLGLPVEFLDLCADRNLEPAAVLHGFIADLCEIRNYADNPRTDGLSSNGSDERRLAEEYFDRAFPNWSDSE